MSSEMATSAARRRMVADRPIGRAITKGTTAATAALI
jgi:hypothetical protein